MASIDPAAAALLAFGSGLSGMAGPSRMPVGLGQGLGASVQQGLAGYMQAQDMARRERMAEMEMLEFALRAQQFGQAQQQQAKQREAVAQMVKNASPELRALAEASPEQFARAAIGQQFGKPAGPLRVRPGETLLDPATNQPIYQAPRAPEKPPEAPSDIRMMREMGLDPKNPEDQYRFFALKRQGNEPLVPVFEPSTGLTTYAQRSEAAGKMPPPAKGMRISYDEEGRPIIETGVTTGPGGAIQRPTANELEKEMVADTAAMQRLQAIEQSWRPEYSQILPRAGMEWAALKDKFGQLSQGEQKSLKDFAAARQDSISNLNRTIKEITGAAMSIQEAERITNELPAPGTGIFDGDSPTVFKSKLDNAMRKIRLSYARKAYIRTKGFPQTPDFAGISLDQMPGIIDQRGEELEQQLVAQGVPAEQVQERVAAQLRQEFGI